MSCFSQDTPKKVIFLGTPAAAAKALEILLTAENLFKIILVVSQPPARSTRRGSEIPSPVHALAVEKGIPVLTPESVKGLKFLTLIKELTPDLCITAAYGNYLPKAFLEIPIFGTLNIHPSLLPLYRGASPVQRCLEHGDSVTGVSVLLSTAIMDAGPILAQESYTLNQAIKSFELLEILFKQGARLFIKNCSPYFSGQAKLIEQDSTKVSQAAKIIQEEGVLTVEKNALILHNKVRAFAEWPGTKIRMKINDEIVDVKVITTEVRSYKTPVKPLFFNAKALEIACAENTTLAILELQLPGKKVILAQDFKNGLKDKILALCE